jgi:Mg2+/Co2+ transporter CorC
VHEVEKEKTSSAFLMAKGFAELQRARANIKALLRPAVFVPESKGLKSTCCANSGATAN